jgi:citronellol/citronellal dehydrogenase
MSYDSVFRPGLFAGRHIVVTGGGSGIGRCTAHELSALGGVTALVGRRIEKLDKVAAEIVAAGGAAPSVHACDIRVEDEVKRTVAAIFSAHRRIDGLVNNAGGQFAAPLRDISQKGFETVVRNNLTGGFLMARECFLAAMEQNGGAIVNIIADMWTSMPTMGHSGAARAGMLNFTMTAAVEWACAGVRVNAVAPGWIDSSGLDTYPAEQQEAIRNCWRLVPLKRLGTVSEVSAAIVFLLSDAASFISGSCLRVDGAAPNARTNFPMRDHTNSRPYSGFPLESAAAFLRRDDADAES